ncbi:hypothetical protein BK646_31490 [Pseudomonas protegens]|nr:hypothetical protein BK646_31490 [Pseudomonas protegens]
MTVSLKWTWQQSKLSMINFMFLKLNDMQTATLERRDNEKKWYYLCIDFGDSFRRRLRYFS